MKLLARFIYQVFPLPSIYLVSFDLQDQPPHRVKCGHRRSPALSMFDDASEFSGPADPDRMGSMALFFKSQIAGEVLIRRSRGERA